MSLHAELIARLRAWVCLLMGGHWRLLHVDGKHVSLKCAACGGADA